MKNVEISMDENIMTIKVDVTQEIGPSKSGKTIVIATTEGNQRIAILDGSEITVGLNVYKYPE